MSDHAFQNADHSRTLSVDCSVQLETLKEPLAVSLHATPEPMIQVRQNRLLSMGADTPYDDYIDRRSVADEVAYARKLSAQFSWAQLDVTRRSIEETTAAVLAKECRHQRTLVIGHMAAMHRAR
ncbi:kinase/pyrophosphorylase [Bradyrhizobium australiense]